MLIAPQKKLIWMILIPVLLYACVPIVTPTEQYVHAPGATPCSPVTPMSVRATPTVVPPQQFTHFFILVDISGSYHTYSSSSLTLVNDGLVQLLKPGDRLTIAWLGSNSGQPAQKLFDENSHLPDLPHLDPDELSPMPERAPHIEIPTPRSDGTTMDRAKQVRIATAISALNQANDNKYYCEVMRWNQELMSEDHVAEPSHANDEYQEFLRHAGEALHEARNTDMQGYTDVYSALWDVSEAFAIDRATGQFQKFVLIIFSDLKGNVVHENVKNNIDLTQASVIIANYPCDQPSVCQAEMDVWKTDLKNKFDAQTVDILRPEDTSVQSIVYLSRR